jgi:hypothetical protein
MAMRADGVHECDLLRLMQKIAAHRGDPKGSSGDDSPAEEGCENYEEEVSHIEGPHDRDVPVDGLYSYRRR